MIIWYKQNEGGQRNEYIIKIGAPSEKCGYPVICCLGRFRYCNRGSLYFSEIKGFLPCDLCWYQRIFMYPLTILLGIAYFKDDVGITKYVLPPSFVGGGISLYHVTIQRIFSATGNAVACGKVPCYTDYLNWFGFITIPLLALIAFIIIIVMLWGIGKTPKSS